MWSFVLVCMWGEKETGLGAVVFMVVLSVSATDKTGISDSFLFHHFREG